MPLLILCFLVNFFASAQEQLELFPEPVESKKIMSELVDEMGEYFDESVTLNETYALSALETEDLSTELYAAVEKLVKKRREQLQPQGDVYEATVYKVYNKQNNTVVGYVVAILDSIDHPLWDGSGETAYLTLDLVVVDSVEWNG
jgi:molybdopterin converting factor small subunit